MRVKGIRLRAALVALMLLAGCSLPPTRLPAGGTAPPPPDPATASRLAAAANALGFDILAGLAAGGKAENVVISPLSLATVFTMLLHSAGGETATAIGKVLHLENPGDPAAREGFAALLHSLSRAGGGVELAAANSLWPQRGYPVEAAYLDQMRQLFGAEVREVDLGDPQTAQRIDQWVAEATRGRIDKMAEHLGLPSPQLVLVLLNAVYFKGSWTDPFDPARTRAETFTRADGTGVAVPFMSRRGEYGHAQGEGFQLLRLPYGADGRFGMEILFPDPGLSLDQVQSRLNPASWAAATAQLAQQDLLVSLPRFELEYLAEELDEVLQELGMAIAYSPESDFTPLSPADPWLSTVQHKTYVKVDEEGTEAAAVTGAAMRESLPPEFRADRPFLFAIRDTQTGAILFLGRVTNPAGDS